jgi:uncharacterized protein YkwD
MRTTMVLRHRDILVAAALALSCTALVFAAATATPAAAKASACKEWGSVVPDDLAPGQARKAIVCLLNAERQKAGVGPLESNKKLQRAAQNHTDHMDGTGCFDHECPGEADLSQRLQGVDYLIGSLIRWVCGENIAWGSDKLGTPKAIVQTWMNSPPHRSTLLNAAFHDVGIGFAAGTPNDGGDRGGIYTADFGLRVD